MNKLLPRPGVLARQRRVRASAHAAPTTTLIANLRPQSQVTVYGMVRSIGTVRVGAGLAYHFTLVDGSGELDVLLTGQPDIGSLQPSTRIFAEGTLGSYDSKLALWNPSYTIEPAK